MGWTRMTRAKKAQKKKCWMVQKNKRKTDLNIELTVFIHNSYQNQEFYVYLYIIYSFVS